MRLSDEAIDIICQSHEANLEQKIMSNEWFQHPSFRFRRNLEGYDCETATFGCRSGPSIEVETMLHEVGHAIDFSMQNQLERLKKRQWGFRIPRHELGFHCPKTIQITDRECRVWAIQRHMQVEFKTEKGSWQDFEKEVTQLATWLADEWISLDGMSRSESVVFLLNKHYAAFNIVEIRSHWNKVLSYIAENFS